MIHIKETGISANSRRYIKKEKQIIKISIVVKKDNKSKKQPL